MSNSIEQLTSLFRRFPGIGPRQAKRFVYYLLRQHKGYRDDLSRGIRDLSQNIRICAESFQYFYSEDSHQRLSPIARDSNRDSSLLMVVEKDTDLENIEKTKIYDGYYFVLGGTLPVLEKDPQRYIRAQELKNQVRTRLEAGLSEIILALSATPEGEHTTEYIKESLSEFSPQLSISTLGRGLSTGSELEYIDTETMKNALSNRG